MNVIYKAFKYRIYPTEQQKVLLNKHFGACRFIYNLSLECKIKAYKQNKKNLSVFDLMKQLTDLKKDDEFKWLYEINAQSLQCSLINLNNSYNNFFKHKKNFPKFKSKNKDFNSFSIPQDFKIKNDKLYINKFREGIKINLHRKHEGKLLFCTVSKTKTNQYYASITCEIQNYKQYNKINNSVGIDTGIKTLAVLSNGKVYTNINSLKEYENKLKYLQRQFSKKKKGSRNREKYRLKIAKIYQKITNIRNDYLHKVTTEIVKNHDNIFVEDLQVKNMIKNHFMCLVINTDNSGIFFKIP
jgi:putative transposase